MLLIVAYNFGGHTIGLISAIYWIPATSFFMSVCLRDAVLHFKKLGLFYWFGSLTFVFYMSHALCIKFFNPLLKEIGLTDIPRAFCILIISIIGAIVLHYGFEQPINAYFANKITKTYNND